MGFTRDIPNPLSLPNTAVKRDNNSEFSVAVVHGDLDGNAKTSDDGVSEVEGTNGLTLVLQNKRITGSIDTSVIGGGKLQVQNNNANVGQETIINLIPGANIGISASDDTVNGRINITISALGSQDKTFVFEQMFATSTWNITHNLNKFPAIEVVDSGGTVCIGEIDYIDLNNVRLRFSVPFSGVAYFN